ncbi:MAG: TolC family protein [Prevotella sp.]
MRYTIQLLTLCLVMSAFHSVSVAQETELQLKYRDMAVAYSHDLKSAGKAVEASLQATKAAAKDLYPKLRGDANFQYTGNPLRLTLDLPSMGSPMTFTGKDLKYGIGLSLVQQVYTGGRLLETIRSARYQHEISLSNEEMLRTAVCCHADIQYWNTVARKEIATITTDYFKSVSSLAQTIRERVESGMTDRQDLLMIEVMQNEAELQMSQAKKDFDNSLMALNSLIGRSLSHSTEIDDTVMMVDRDIDALQRTFRPEQKIAETQVKIAESSRRLTASGYKPQLSVGIDGTYSSPGYDFRTDLDPNYAIYAKMTVPLFEWGKRRNELRASDMRHGMAVDNARKVEDEINLEILTARNSLRQTMTQAKLAQNSLDKAFQNEALAIERYKAGKASVIEVIDAQTYRQRAQVNLVQAKTATQCDNAMLLKALNGYR